jgi:ketosteroid isomerase-like protein
MSEQNKKVALGFIESMGAGDAAAFDACLAPNAIAVAKGFCKLSGTRQRDQMVNAVKAFKQIVPNGFQPTFKTVTAEGDRVMIEWEGKAKLKNGADYNNQYVMAFTLKDGKITQVNEYFCTKLADEVMYPVAVTMGV